MSEESYEFEDDLFIDLNRLEWEVARQAKLFGKWSRRWSHATKLRDKYAERVKTKRSQLILHLKDNWQNEGFTKEPTGPQYEAYYRVDEQYRLIKKKFIKWEGEVNMLYAAMRSLEHKRSSLDIEQKLYAQEYFSVPYEVPEFKEKVQSEMEQAQEKSLEETDRIPKKLVRR